MYWQLPTLPPFKAVPSARRGLTSLFGMGRGGHPRHCRQEYLRADCKTELHGKLRAISTTLLNPSPDLHIWPIEVVFYDIPK